MTGVDIKKVALFLGLTFGVSWLIAGGYYAWGGRLNSPLALPVLILYMFVPMLVSVVVQKFVCREPVAEPLGISFRVNRWFTLAWLLPIVFALATIATSLLLPGVEYAPDLSGLLKRLASTYPSEQLDIAQKQLADLPVHVFWISLLGALVAGPTINAVAAFGEELGWRGLLQRELAPLGFWKSSLLIGIFWGLWHAPIIAQGYNYPQHPLAGVFMMTIFTVLFSPLIGYVRLQAQSVLAAAVMHGSLNAAAGLALMIVDGSDLTVGVTGLAGLIVLAALNLCLIVQRRRMSPKAAQG